MCSSCQLGTQKRDSVLKDVGGSSLKKRHSQLGDLLHVDYFSSPQPGLIPQTSDTLEKDAHFCSIMHVHSASDYISCALQKTNNA